MKGIYLGAFVANHPGHEITYQDINGKRDLGGDMMDICLKDYDYIIATPPCNWWSKANIARKKGNPTEYSKKTKHLLPQILKKLTALGKPFIVENVRNFPMFKEAGLYDLPLFIYQIGRHTYWTNVMMNPNIKQIWDGYHELKPPSKRQGGINVHLVIETWLMVIGA